MQGHSPTRLRDTAASANRRDIRRTAWSLFAALAGLLASATPAAAITSDARVDAVIARLDAASLTVCENVEPDGSVTSCGGEIAIVSGTSYNAWAKRGRISLTRRLVDTSSDDELAFVIAHEMAHVILGHSGSTKKNELAADYWAAKMMTRSGFDARSAAPVLARLQTRRILGFPFSLFSHPANSRRLREIARALADEPAIAVDNSIFQTGAAPALAVSILP